MPAYPPLAPAPLGCRRLTGGDLPLLHRWLNTPHEQRWWASNGKAPTMEAVIAEYLPVTTGEEPPSCRFVRDIVFAAPGVRVCVIGPDETNAAIRAYEKAGFSDLRTIDRPDEPRPEYLMRLERFD